MGIKSRQPRFKSEEELFGTYYSKISIVVDNEPPYQADSRTRDAWLRRFVMEEPNLSGVVSTVVAIDKNRGWRMIGGKNQVSKYTKILHNIASAPGVYGWRHGISHLSQSFWTTDMGGLLELGRDGQGGPLRALYNMDPARCKLTGNYKYPLNYYPRNGKMVKFSENDFIRVSSMVSTDEVYNGLGYSAVSRCADLTKIMIAVYQHDAEMLGARAPRGLLLLNGITEKQWVNAMQAREADLEGKERDYFTSVAVLASASATVEAKLLALSQLPTSFNLREWMDMVMFGYALCFGYDPSEFWPVQFGAIGRGTETEIQHEKATGKGRLDCVLGLQEQLQMHLPDSLEFVFDQRDEKGDLLHAQVDQAWANVVSTLAGSLVSQAEGRVLLAAQGVIPQSWAPTADVQSTDLLDEQNDPVVEEDEQEQEQPTEEGDVSATQKKTRDLLLSMPRVLRAIEKFPAEPLVEYSYPENRIAILAYRADDLVNPKLWSVKWKKASPLQKRSLKNTEQTEPTILSKLGRFMVELFK